MTLSDRLVTVVVEPEHGEPVSQTLLVRDLTRFDKWEADIAVNGQRARVTLTITPPIEVAAEVPQ